jgi:hypothetical protein
MKILVCISHVLILPKITNGDSEFDTNGVQYNPNDEFGLTRAGSKNNKELLL